MRKKGLLIHLCGVNCEISTFLKFLLYKESNLQTNKTKQKQKKPKA